MQAAGEGRRPRKAESQAQKISSFGPACRPAVSLSLKQAKSLSVSSGPDDSYCLQVNGRHSRDPRLAVARSQSSQFAFVRSFVVVEGIGACSRREADSPWATWIARKYGARH